MKHRGQRSSESAVGTTLIEPSRRSLLHALVELWAHRELTLFLIWRDIKVRYKQTLLGAAWAIIQPVVLMVIFSLVFGQLGHLPSNGVPYPIFSYAALLPWTLFAEGLVGASASVVGNATLVSKVYVARLCLPVAAALSALIDFAFACIALAVLMVYYGVTPTLNILWIPLLLLLALVTALGVGIWLAALNVRYRDFQYVVPFVVQVWLFATPVAYSSTLIPHQWRLLYALNPMAGVVEGFRWALLGTHTQPGGMIAVSSATALLVLGAGVLYFKRAERTFADVI
jgi:lipopolysaccharide transport system permease protein